MTLKRSKVHQLCSTLVFFCLTKKHGADNLLRRRRRHPISSRRLIITENNRMDNRPPKRLCLEDSH